MFSNGAMRPYALYGVMRASGTTNDVRGPGPPSIARRQLAAPSSCRRAFAKRGNDVPTSRYDNYGFRVARTLQLMPHKTRREAPLWPAARRHSEASGWRKRAFLAMGQRSSWSPDSKKIVFGRSGVDNGILITTSPRINSGSSRPWERTRAWAGQDGRWIAYVTGSGPAEAIWAADASGGKPPFRVAAGCMPSWSSDGKTLFFAAFDQGQLDVEPKSRQTASSRRQRCDVQYPIDGRMFRRTASAWHTISAIRLSFSRSMTGKLSSDLRNPRATCLEAGRPIAGSLDSACGIQSDPTPCFILDVEASLARRVEPRSLTMPAWSPDGTKITFDRRLTTRTEIWIFDAEAIKKLPTFKMEAR